jgi:peptidoglycan/xylan/chitin deacetylase (PgdA/CDA1 family)
VTAPLLLEEAMIEAGIGLAVVLGLVVVGLAVWRYVRGPSRRRFGTVLRVTALSLVVIPLVLVVAWRLINSQTFQLFGGIVPSVETSEPLVALTLDDGPTARHTAEVLAILREAGVRATFFVVGQALERNPAECQQIVAEGHELGNHSTSHQRLVLKPYSLIRDEIEQTDRLIRACGYEGEIHFRSPNGKKLVLLPYYLSRTQRKNIFWDVGPESEREIAADADRIVQHVLAETRPGSIILLHVMYESRAESREALPGILQGLQERGYRFVTVSELLAAGE